MSGQERAATNASDAAKRELILRLETLHRDLWRLRTPTPEGEFVIDACRNLQNASMALRDAWKL